MPRNPSKPMNLQLAQVGKLARREPLQVTHVTPDPIGGGLFRYSAPTVSALVAAVTPVTQESAEDRRAFYAGRRRSKSTGRGYIRALERFEAFCAKHPSVMGPGSLVPPSVVGDYLSHLADAGKKASTIEYQLAAISAAYAALGLNGLTKQPEVKDTWAGIQRTLGVAHQKKAPIAARDFVPYFETMRQDLRGSRDKAILLVGFYGGLRRSEVVAIDVTHVTFDPEGCTIRLPFSKANQEGEEESVSILYNRRHTICAVRALEHWLRTSGLSISDGPLFRPINRHGTMLKKRLTDQSVAAIVKKAVAAGGFDPAAFAGHSLRRGLVTAAVKAGKAQHVIMRQTRHRDVQTFAGYIAEARRYEDNVTENL